MTAASTRGRSSGHGRVGLVRLCPTVSGEEPLVVAACVVLVLALILILGPSKPHP